jgi:hypothetical protein
MHTTKSLILSLFLFLAFATKVAYAIDLPPFEAKDCNGNQECIENLSNGPYMLIALGWNKFAEPDKRFCLDHEEYAKDYAGFYYKGLLDCMMVMDMKRTNIH